MRLDRFFSKKRVFLAPMEGVTNALFRKEICALGSVDVVATEFVRITGAHQKVRPFVRHGEVPLQIQLMGKSPEMVRDCILFLKEKKVLREDDWIDLNVGCPSKRVNAHGAGAALLLEPQKLFSLLGMMRQVHSGPLSMKTRVGFHDDARYQDLLNMLADSPIDFLTLHARKRCDGYATPVNLEYLTQAVQALPFPVVGNGDIWTAEDAQRMIECTGVAGVMCGRGVLRNPLLCVEIQHLFSGTAPAQSDQEKRQLLFRFAENLLDEYEKAEHRRGIFVGRAKEFLGWFCKNPLVGRALFVQIKRSRSLAEIRTGMLAYYHDLRGRDLPLCA